MGYKTAESLAEMREIAAHADSAAERAAVLHTAGAFALFTVQDSTRKAEERLAWWHENGRPHTLPDGLKPRFPAVMRKNLASLDAAVADDAFVATLWNGDGGYGTAARLAERVHGLATAKSSFTLACAGLGRTACIDSHIVDAYLDLLRPHLTPSEVDGRKAPSTWKRYVAAADALATEWGSRRDHARGQWGWWLSTAVTYTDHGILPTVVRERLGEVA